jgi:selenocysteine-specific elongation factor
MPIASLRTELGIPADLLDDLIASWSIVRDKTTVRLPEHGVALSAEQRKLADEALATLKAGGVSPPELQLDRALVQALERSGEIVLATPSIAVHADVWRDIVERVRGLGTFTVAEFRDAVGTSRKYAVPFLEKLDATGVTRRKGDVREVR